MKKKLYLSNKIEPRKSEIHGWGLFAKEDIPKDYVIEESYFVELPDTLKETDTIWRYSWNANDKQVIPFGFANFYNSSKEESKSNIKTETFDDYFKFTTTRHIQKDEELLMYYYPSVLYYNLKIKGNN